MERMLRDKWAIAFFALPALTVFTVFVIGVSVRTVIGSFYDWDGILPGKFAGFRMYAKMLSDSVFYTSLRNGFISAAMLLAGQTLLGLLLALILSDRKLKGKKAFRMSFFVPVVLSVTVGTQLWLFIFRGDGLLNMLLERLGTGYEQYWLNDTKWAILPVSFVNAWQYMGIYLALFYAGIKSIPEHFYEAALIDGCGRWRTWLHVTIPLLREVMKICVLLAMLGGLNQFAHNQILTAGGPGSSTYSLTLLMYNKAFANGDFGYGCAVAIVIIVQALLVSWAVNQLFGKERIVY